MGTSSRTLLMGATSICASRAKCPLPAQLTGPRPQSATCAIRRLRSSSLRRTRPIDTILDRPLRAGSGLSCASSFLRSTLAIQLAQPQQAHERAPIEARFGMGLTVAVSSLFTQRRHSEDRAVASNNAAALAASNVSAVPPTTRSSPRPARFLALRRTSHVGTLSSVKTKRRKPPTSVETAGLGQSGGSGRQSVLAINSHLRRRQVSIEFTPA